MSADNCVSIETAEWESVNTGLSAIIARDVVDVDLALDVQKGTTVDAFILGPEVTVVAKLQSGTYPSISWVLAKNAPLTDGPVLDVQRGTTVDASILGSEVTQDARAGME